MIERSYLLLNHVAHVASVAAPFWLIQGRWKWGASGRERTEWPSTKLPRPAGGPDQSVRIPSFIDEGPRSFEKMLDLAARATTETRFGHDFGTAERVAG